ncbi:MAG: hypothetical protein M5U34_45130 [Chloroflexi bacterium]|nr:hypothetical protein [Chloroflexota bacterium]
MFRRGSFFVGKRTFGLKSSVRDALGEFDIFRTFTRVTLPTLLLSVLFCGGLLVLTRLAFDFGSRFQWPTQLLGLFDVVEDTNEAAYDGFLITIIAVVGVFLTLYLSNLSSVAGAIYANKPEQIRILLIREKAGEVYVRFLIFLTLVSVIFLLVGVVGDYRPKTAIVSVGFLGLISIRSFITLSNYALRFFDPTVFVDKLLVDLGKWSHQATIEGHRWDDPPFQNHYRRQAVEVINGLKILVEIGHEERHLQRKALATLLVKLQVFLSIYLERKRFIPSDSRWYKFVPHHQEWFLSPYHAINLATQTQTALQPEMKPDPNWIEKEIFDLEVSSLEICLQGGQIGIALTVLDDFMSLFEALGTEWDVLIGHGVLSNVVQVLRPFIAKPETDDKNEVAVETLAIIERLAILPIGLLLGFTKRLETIELENLYVNLAQTDWRKEKAIYELGLPPNLLERLEFIQKRLLFELEAEGKIVSADWYLKQLVSQSIVESMLLQLDELLNIITDFYLREIQVLLDEEDYLGAATLIYQGLQYCNKAIAHIPKVHQMADSLETERTLPGLKWETRDWKEIEETLNEAQNQLVVHLVKSIPQLTVAKSKELPDYLGRAVHLAGEWCFKILMDNDVELFLEIFPHYFSGCFNMREILREELSEQEPLASVRVFSEPVIDLCELSGYVYFMAELHQDARLWNVCSATWERFFQKNENGLVLLAATIAYYRSIFGLTHRSILRTQWKMQIDRILESLPRKQVALDYSGSRIPHYAEVIEHSSLVVRVMGGAYSRYLSMYDGLDLFIDLYLLDKPDASDLNFGTTGRLLDSIDRWQRNEERFNEPSE